MFKIKDDVSKTLLAAMMDTNAKSEVNNMLADKIRSAYLLLAIIKKKSE